MSNLRITTTLTLLGILLVPPHWCCFVAWGGEGGPECCRTHSQAPLLAAVGRSSGCCQAEPAAELELTLALRLPASGQLPCACCTQIREAVSKQSVVWDGSIAFVPFAVHVAPEAVRGLIATAYLTPPHCGRSLQTILCRWLC
ncbi:MAG: hypothetical protein C0483_11055 [Pirellula sp.]|nr:hypothetical protein [Pirellula sp.]